MYVSGDTRIMNNTTIAPKGTIQLKARWSGPVATLVAASQQPIQRRINSNSIANWLEDEVREEGES